MYKLDKIVDMVLVEGIEDNADNEKLAYKRFKDMMTDLKAQLSDRTIKVDHTSLAYDKGDIVAIEGQVNIDGVVFEITRMINKEESKDSFWIYSDRKDLSADNINDIVNFINKRLSGDLDDPEPTEKTWLSYYPVDLESWTEISEPDLKKLIRDVKKGAKVAAIGEEEEAYLFTYKEGSPKSIWKDAVIYDTEEEPELSPITYKPSPKESKEVLHFLSIESDEWRDEWQEDVSGNTGIEKLLGILTDVKKGSDFAIKGEGDLRYIFTFKGDKDSAYEKIVELEGIEF